MLINKKPYLFPATQILEVTFKSIYISLLNASSNWFHIYGFDGFLIQIYLLNLREIYYPSPLCMEIQYQNPSLTNKFSHTRKVKFFKQKLLMTCFSHHTWKREKKEKENRRKTISFVCKLIDHHKKLNHQSFYFLLLIFVFFFWLIKRKRRRRKKVCKSIVHSKNK